MLILISPDKFKGTLTAEEVCDTIEKGLLNADRSLAIHKLPLADGGDGTFEVFKQHTGAHEFMVEVHDPLMRKITASYLISADGTTAFIEMARASGLVLLKAEERNPMKTTSFGTGELISAALQRGVSKIILGIGGSANNDAGLGVIEALGGKVYDENRHALKPIGKSLIHVAKIDVSGLDARLRTVELIAICDVANPFHGHEGAAFVYARQKGANDQMITQLDQGLQCLAKSIEKHTGINLQNVPGSGAGGGLGGGAYALLGAQLCPGTEVIFDLVGAEMAVKNADAVITGEGKLDRQTLQGKLIAGLIQLAHKYAKKMIIVCGVCELTEEELKSLHATKVFSLTEIAGKEKAFSEPAVLLEKLAQDVLYKQLIP